LHGPIGLDIGSQSPEEIGVAILAQIIAAKNGKLAAAPGRPRAAAAV
jgi:xanthine dehydrogenase accessory factor